MDRTLDVNRGRLSVLVALVILSFSLLPLIETPAAGGVGTSFLGTPIRLEFTSATVVLLLVIVLTCAGIDTLVREHPRVRRGEVTRTFSFWLIPVVTVIVAAQLLGNLADAPLWVLGLIITAVIMWLTIMAEYATVDPEGPLAGRARLFLTAMAYILAALLFALIWNTRARSLISATMTFLAAASLAFDLLNATSTNHGRVLLLSVAIGAVLAEGNWAINYWRSSTFTVAIAQLLAFYALVGLTGQYLIDRITRRVMIEFAVVMSIAMLLLLRGRA